MGQNSNQLFFFYSDLFGIIHRFISGVICQLHFKVHLSRVVNMVIAKDSMLLEFAPNILFTCLNK
jgi:hypothetical protein